MRSSFAAVVPDMHGVKGKIRSRCYGIIIFNELCIGNTAVKTMPLFFFKLILRPDKDNQSKYNTKIVIVILQSGQDNKAISKALGLQYISIRANLNNGADMEQFSTFPGVTSWKKVPIRRH